MSSHRRQCGQPANPVEQTPSLFQLTADRSTLKKNDVPLLAARGFAVDPSWIQPHELAIGVATNFRLKIGMPGEYLGKIAASSEVSAERSCRDVCGKSGPAGTANAEAQWAALVTDATDKESQFSVLCYLRECFVGSWVSQSAERKNERQRAFVAFRRALTRLGSMSVLTLPLLAACAPKLNAGEWQCPADEGSAGGTEKTPVKTDPVTASWSTSFEDGFCDYANVAGYCYGDDPYLFVTEPHRPGGKLAAEFKVVGGGWNQTRCVRQGSFPESAYYGSWYFISQPLQAAKNWNLWHFGGSDDPNLRVQPSLWDVTLFGTPNGEWELGVRDYLGPQGEDTIYLGHDHKPVPIGSWFHIEAFLKRAADSTGKIALYQDGVLLLEQTNLKSDASKFTEWFVGDWAENATPPDSSLYVDDVSIGRSLSSTSATP